MLLVNNFKLSLTSDDQKWTWQQVVLVTSQIPQLVNLSTLVTLTKSFSLLIYIIKLKYSILNMQHLRWVCQWVTPTRTVNLVSKTYCILGMAKRARRKMRTPTTRVPIPKVRTQKKICLVVFWRLRLMISPQFVHGRNPASLFTDFYAHGKILG